MPTNFFSPPKPTEHLLATSFDFDGAIYNTKFLKAIKSPYYFSSTLRNYKQPRNKNRLLLACNKKLIQHIKEIQKRLSIARSFTFIGSARQDRLIDSLGVKQYGVSCFEDISVLSAHLNAEHNPLLLADIHGELTPGTSYQRAFDQTFSDWGSRWVYDASKFTILYAQMHHLAKEHPTSKITFCFYDDQTRILTMLNNLFERYPSIIPRNIELRLFEYKGGAPSIPQKHQGCGDTDVFFDKTILKLTERALGDRPKYQTLLNMASQIDLDSLSHAQAEATLKEGYRLTDV